jgi:hypothetical protein
MELHSPHMNSLPNARWDASVCSLHKGNHRQWFNGCARIANPFSQRIFIGTPANSGDPKKWCDELFIKNWEWAEK